MSVCENTRAGESVQIWLNATVRVHQCLKIDCRRDLGIDCIVIKLYLMMILNFEFHIIFMS